MDSKKKDDKQTIEQQYIALEKTHNLPTFKELDAEFDIASIEEEKRPLKEIAKRMFERTDIFKKILESTMQGDAGVLAMQEAEFLSDTEHETMGEILRKLMLLDRKLLAAELDNTDKAYAEYITNTNDEWKPIKKDLTPIIDKMIAGWKKNSDKKRQQHYLG